MNKRPEHIARTILDAYLNEDLSPELEEKIAVWFKSDHRLEEKYAALEELYHEQVRFDPAPAREAFEGYDELCGRLGFPGEDGTAVTAPEEKPAKVRIGRRLALRVAAIVIPAALLIGGGYWYMNRPETIQPPVMAEMVVPEGEKEQLVLADGSDVWVNSGSRIRYAEDFSGNRTVELEGEAYFTVARDEEHPFVVKTEHLDVRVLGTEFNVTDFPEGNRSLVWVKNGRVEIGTESQKHVINGGEMLEYDLLTGEVVVQPIPPGMFRNWMLEDPVFVNAPLGEIFTDISAYFDVKIEFAPGFSDSERFDVDFAGGESLEQILFILEQVSGRFNHTYRDGTIVISKK